LGTFGPPYRGDFADHGTVARSPDEPIGEGFDVEAPDRAGYGPQGDVGPRADIELEAKALGVGSPAEPTPERPEADDGERHRLIPAGDIESYVVIANRQPATRRRLATWKKTPEVIVTIPSRTGVARQWRCTPTREQFETAQRQAEDDRQARVAELQARSAKAAAKAEASALASGRPLCANSPCPNRAEPGRPVCARCRKWRQRHGGRDWPEILDD
jgi:hypothetical protein